MERYPDYTSTHSPGSFLENGEVINNNAAPMNKRNNAMDLKRLSSRIICSNNITRQNLNWKPSTSDVLSTADDDEQFFNKMKSEIDKNLMVYSKENDRPRTNCETNSLTIRKKRPIIDAETQGVIKRFKKDSNKISCIQSLDSTNIIQPSNNNNILRESHNILKNVNEENIIQYKNLFSNNSLNSRIPPNKYIFQVTSKLQKNVLPIAAKEATILHEEYEESLFYGMMFLTPPDGNLVQDNEDS